jgi:hypothetical protein
MSFEQPHPAAATRHPWKNLRSGCANPDCDAGRSLWQRMRWIRAGFYLQGAWYCSPQCLEQALRRTLLREHASNAPSSAKLHRIPLGLLLLSRGQITNPQLRAALDRQRVSGQGRIGHWLCQMGFATERQVLAGLGMQWSCPVLYEIATPAGDCLRLLPVPLLERFSMLPIRFVPSSRMLYLAFSDAVDYGVLCAVERMLDCRTEACLVSRSLLSSELQRLARDRNRADVVLERPHDVADLARITSGYALKSGAENVLIAVCGDLIWARLVRKGFTMNLLFGCRCVAAGTTPSFPWLVGKN